MPRRRIHPVGHQNADRAALIERGGKMLQIALEPEDLAMIATLRLRDGLATDRAAIRRALAIAIANTGDA